jgi:A/G-specific adenine glycosylase
MNHAGFRRHLLTWYEEQRRDLPWRATRDPYAIWVSEIMLQQTRVATVIPYYKRFLSRFPTLESLAAAPEEELLHAWSGLGYYSRARNMQRAARSVEGSFPTSLAGVRSLPGIGAYTAAAVASIAFGLPHAAVDGNVLRVTARLLNDDGDISTADVRGRLTSFAGHLLDPERPGDFNQAMMELGATVCLPRQPRCLVCPVSEMCGARASGTQELVPVKSARSEVVRIRRTVLIVEHGNELLLWQRPRDSGKLAGFWELPEDEHLEQRLTASAVGEFRHSITNHAYTFGVCVSRHKSRDPRPSCKNSVSSAWIEINRLPGMVLSTVARKAIQLYQGKKSRDI